MLSFKTTQKTHASHIPHKGITSAVARKIIYCIPSPMFKKGVQGLREWFSPLERVPCIHGGLKK